MPKICLDWYYSFCFRCALGYLDHPDVDLGLNTDMYTIVKVMSSADSGLVVRDRMWLKVTIPQAFMGKFSTVFNLSQGFQ